MTKKERAGLRREGSLTRERIVNASIELLDSVGESGLTFRALAEKLATGAGAIYWHIADKSDLINAACDEVLSRALAEKVVGSTPKAAIRAVALSMFDTMDAHPWVGSALIRAQLQSPMVRVAERIGQQVRALGVPEKEQWAAVTALFSYILGVGGHNAANGQLARERGLHREEFLDAVAKVWSELDEKEFPFTRSVAGLLRKHDDRKDFIAGIDLILNGIEASKESSRTRRPSRSMVRSKP